MVVRSPTEKHECPDGGVVAAEATITSQAKGTLFLSGWNGWRAVSSLFSVPELPCRDGNGQVRPPWGFLLFFLSFLLSLHVACILPDSHSRLLWLFPPGDCSGPSSSSSIPYSSGGAWAPLRAKFRLFTRELVLPSGFFPSKLSMTNKYVVLVYGCISDSNKKRIKSICLSC